MFTNIFANDIKHGYTNVYNHAFSYICTHIETNVHTIFIVYSDVYTQQSGRGQS